jgi:hypothetical protein
MMDRERPGTPPSHLPAAWEGEEVAVDYIGLEEQPNLGMGTINGRLEAMNERGLILFPQSDDNPTRQLYFFPWTSVIRIRGPWT